MIRPLFNGALGGIAVAACLVLLIPGSAFGQAGTGQIRGQVSDEATGAPVAGAKVIVVGTTFSNLTNEQGFYFINGVPAGPADLRVVHDDHRTVERTGARVLAGHATTLDFQLDVSNGEAEIGVADAIARADAIVPGARTTSESIVEGALVDQLPLDEAAGIVVLQPGVSGTNLGRTIRGGRPDAEAVLIDGLLSRGFGPGISDNLTLPTNALEQVGVNVGTFSAEFGEAQSGLVSFVTRSGGPDLTGSLELMSDQLGPDAWRTNFNRAELTLGGPVAGPVTFFVAGTASGQDAFTTQFAPNRFAIDGVDTCDVQNFCEGSAGGPGLGEPATFRLPRASSASDQTDFVDVAAPRFVEFDNGRTVPFGRSQGDLFHTNLGWQLPRGSRVSFSINRNRFQELGHAGFTTNFLPDGVDGALRTRSSYALSWFQTLKRTPDEQIALDLLVGYSRDRDTNGMLDPRWWLENQDPAFGFMLGSADFAFDDPDRTVTGFDPFDPSEEFINAYRSNAAPRDSLVLFANRNDLAGTSQSLRGLSGNLRSNPYALATSLPFNGPGNAGLSKSSENRLQARGAVDWQLGRMHRVRAGAEYFAIALDAFSQPLVSGLPVPESADPRKLGLFLQNRVDLGRLVFETGIRFDRLDPDVEYPITPGFVFNVPDSLKAGFVRFDPGTGAYVPQFATPCGGVSPENPNGACRSNFVPAETKSEVSPRFGASYALSPRSAFRVSYGRFVQTPAFFGALLPNANFDLQNGNTSDVFARDVDMPSTRIVELGVRQLLGDDVAIDLAVFDKKQRGALTPQVAAFDDPTRAGAVILLTVLGNAAEATDAKGFEISLDKSVGEMIASRLSYGYVDADDAVLGGFQGPAHTVNWTASLTLPADYREGSIVGTILRDVGLFTTARLRSGLPYTRLENQGAGQVGPPNFGGGTPASGIGEASTPWTTEIDLRLTKSFAINEGLDLQAFVDWRNPLDIGNRRVVFLETGEPVNELFQESQLGSRLRDSTLDGDNSIDAFDIRAESPDNQFNVFMLLRAEQRFGNGDGVFSVDEQRAAFGQLYENDFGVNSRFETSDQMMRLGVRLAF